MIKCLHLCFQKAIDASSPRCLPSISSHNRIDQLRNYVFEWNQTVGKRFLNRLLASESIQLPNDVNFPDRRSEKGFKIFSSLDSQAKKSLEMESIVLEEQKSE